jgi:GAF domain-containing protein
VAQIVNGLPDAITPSRDASQAVVTTGAAVIVPDVAADTEYANDQFFLENGVRFYAGVPVQGPDGSTIGVLALLDHEAREFGEADQEKLALEALRLGVRLQKLVSVQAA